MMGKQEKSNRDGFVVFIGNQIYGVKWENWKMMSKELDTGTGVAEEWGIPRLLFNLYLDPKEENALSYEIESLWVRYPAGKILTDHLVWGQLNVDRAPGGGTKIQIILPLTAPVRRAADE
jgi:hypothetical protein